MKKNSSEFHIFSEKELSNKSVKGLIDSSKGIYYKTFVIGSKFFNESKENITFFNTLKTNMSDDLSIMNGKPIDKIINGSNSSAIELEIYSLGGIHNIRTLLFSQETLAAIKEKGCSNLIIDTQKNNRLIEPESAIIFLIKNIPSSISRRLILLNTSGK